MESSQSGVLWFFTEFIIRNPLLWLIIVFSSLLYFGIKASNDNDDDD